jgi:hypothetical protein
LARLVDLSAQKGPAALPDGSLADEDTADAAATTISPVPLAQDMTITALLPDGDASEPSGRLIAASFAQALPLPPVATPDPAALAQKISPEIEPAKETLTPPLSVPIVSATPNGRNLRWVVLGLLAALSLGVFLALLLRPRPTQPPKPEPIAPQPEPVAKPEPVVKPEPVAKPEPVVPQPESPVRPGQQKVSSTPSGAWLFVDGKPAGQTPTQINLDAGRHILTLLADGKALWQETVIGVRPPIQVLLTPSALAPPVSGPQGLKVRCARGGAVRIFIDGHDSGASCPSERLAVSAGEHTIGFFRPGKNTPTEMPTQKVTVKDRLNSSTRIYSRY